jgi:hypothetical protein
MSPADVHAAVPNGIPVPDLDLPVRDCFLVDIRILRRALSTQTGRKSSRPIYSKLQSLRQTRTYNLIYHVLFLYIEAREGRRVRFIFKNLISKLHEFVHETKCVLPVVFGGLALI